MPQERKKSGDTPTLAIGDQIRLAREKRGLTQEQLAVQIQMCRASVNRIEKGYLKHIKMEVLHKIALVTHHPVNYFFTTPQPGLGQHRDQNILDMPDAFHSLVNNLTDLPREHREPLTHLLLAVITWYRNEFISI